jgi:thymidine phosphorylase
VRSAVELICAKRDGQPLSAAEIAWVVDAYVRGGVADEQMSALLMAVVWRGLSPDELTAWCDAYVASGERLVWPGMVTTDKHSTGGVGDKTTLALTPLVAALGGRVPQLSGRGLGHTGGTLDKLESIPGWRAELSVAEMRHVLGTAGGFVCAASDELAPADRLVYALRDVTGTVESIPLIAASIMSKKIAEGTGALVLDVKVGAGAFMKTQAQARELAEVMLGLGARAGVATRAVLSDMGVPLGRTAGNALEVVEALEVLAGGGPADVVELVEVLAAEMLDAAGLDASGVHDALQDGRAMDAWRTMITAQGGDADAVLPTAPVREIIVAEQAGVVSSIDAMAVGTAAWRLGAGRAQKGDRVDAAAGVRWLAGVGERVERGAPLFELHTSDERRVAQAVADLAGACTIRDGATGARPVVLEVLRS